MARGQISVETTQLDSTATQIDGMADAYNNSYSSLFSTVQELRAAWEGKDNVSFTNQIEGFRDDFQRMEQLMREYSAFLKKSANAYRETQSNIESTAKTLSQGN